MRFISDGDNTLFNLEKIYYAYKDHKKKKYFIYVDYGDPSGCLELTYSDEESRDKFFQEITQALIQ